MAPLVEGLVGEGVHVHITRIVVRLEQVGVVNKVAKSDILSTLLDGEEVGEGECGIRKERAVM